MLHDFLAWALVTLALAGCEIEVAWMPTCTNDCHAGLQEEIRALALGGLDDES